MSKGRRSGDLDNYAEGACGGTLFRWRECILSPVTYLKQSYCVNRVQEWTEAFRPHFAPELGPGSRNHKCFLGKMAEKRHVVLFC